MGKKDKDGVGTNHRGAHREKNPNPAKREPVSKRGRAKAVGRAKVPPPPAKNVEGLIAKAIARLSGKK